MGKKGPFEAVLHSRNATRWPWATKPSGKLLRTRHQLKAKFVPYGSIRDGARSAEMSKTGL